MASSQGLPTLPVTLDSLTVSLTGDHSNTQFVNPHTFLWNGVVDNSWVLQRGAQVGITRSNFGYTNGVRVEASGDSINFRRDGVTLQGNDAFNVDIAQRYVSAFGLGDTYEFVVQFSSSIEVPEEFLASYLRPKIPFVDHLASHSTRPAFGTFASFQHDNRSVRVDLVYIPQSDPNSLTCFGQVTRQLAEDDNYALSEFYSAMSRWQADWAEANREASLMIGVNFVPRG